MRNIILNFVVKKVDLEDKDGDMFIVLIVG